MGWSGTKTSLYGRHTHAIDAKGRVSLPAKFRAELGERVVVSEGFDRCLYVHAVENFEALVEKLNTLSLGKKEARDLTRGLLSGAHDAEVDTHGRILLPPDLREYAGLEREVVIVGVSTRVEIWDRQAYEEFHRRVKDELDSIGERLVDAGL